MRIRFFEFLLLLFACCILLFSSVSIHAKEVSGESISLVEEINATATELNGTRLRSDKNSFADMIDRALEKEFTESEQNEGPC